MAARRAVLEALLAAQLPLEKLATELASLPWDSDEVVELRSEHVVGVLERFLRGLLSAEEVQAWADLVEGRDDVALDRLHRNTLSETIFDLANPELSAPLDEAVARTLIVRLAAK